MRMINNLLTRAALVIAVSIHPAGLAADLCVQKANSTDYLSDNPATRCDQSRMGISTDRYVHPTGQSARVGASEATTARWQLRAEDGTVYAALKRWSVQAGWQISWEIPVDFPIEIEDDATGLYEHAVRRVLTAFRVSDYPPHPCFHENRVVRVVRRIQGNDDECK